MRIGIVNDMPMVAEALRRAVLLAPENEVVWTAGDGAEAVKLCARDRPDLVLMDLIMPGMDGVEATRRIMESTPCAVLVVTTNVDNSAAKVFAAMGYGALDAIDTPMLGNGDPTAGARPLLAKIRALSRLVGDHPTPHRPARAAAPSPHQPLVVIGASAGGPGALSTVLLALPRDFPAAIVLVQHVDRRFAESMAGWLATHSALPVRLAAAGDSPAPGTVLVAGTDDHLVVRSDGRLDYTPDPADEIYRPSIDIFFRSICRHWRGSAVGVLLTGMGSDGARGLKAMRDKGHHTIAQDRATSAVYGMPKAAAALSAAVEILPLPAIAPRLTALTNQDIPDEKIV